MRIRRATNGSYFFLRDIESGALWSAGYQPSGVEPDSYQVIFTEDRAEFIRSDAAITTILEVLSRRKRTPRCAAYRS